MHRLTLVILSFLAGYIFIGCENNALLKEQESGCCYPLVIKHNGKVAMEFTYEGNKPVTIKEYENGNLSRRAEIGYNNGKKSAVQFYGSNNSPLDYVIYEYNASKLVSKAKYYRKSQSGNLTIRKQISYQYNSAKRLSKEFHYLQIDSSLMLQEYFTYTYNSAGNISLQKNYNEKGEELATTNYDYDNGQNPFKHIPFFNIIHNLNSNNVSKAVKENPFGEISNTSYSANFNYNKYGFPQEETRSFVGGTELLKIEIQYRCEECGN